MTNDPYSKKKTIKARKKPMVIEAWQATNDIDDSPDWLQGRAIFSVNEDRITIISLEGHMDCKAGDYVIKGIHDEVYPCKREIFEESYEVLSEHY